MSIHSREKFLNLDILDFLKISYMPHKKKKLPPPPKNFAPGTLNFIFINYTLINIPNDL